MDSARYILQRHDQLMTVRMTNVLVWCRFAAGVLFTAIHGFANAHVFVQSYSLPVPFNMYAMGAGLALVLSFVAVAGLARSPHIEFNFFHYHTDSKRTPSSWDYLGKGISVPALLLCIASGLLGTNDAFRNINMTLFWILFMLALPYAVAVFGDFYAAVNPWESLISIAETLTGRDWNGQIHYPNWLGHYPALFFYMLLIVLELFANLRPAGLSIALGIYTVFMFFGSWLFGKRTWIDRAETFGQIFCLLGLMSVRMTKPVVVASMLGRMPFTGILGFRAPDWSICLLILFMLSSTAFDGLHATQPWAESYWKGIYPHIQWVDAVVAAKGGNRYAASTQLFYIWEWLCLLLSPFLYLAIFVLFIWASRTATRSTHSVRDLVFQFSPTLLPIALAYHISHYYTLLLWQVPQIVKMISDPLGLGWNLFGTAKFSVQPLVVDVGTIWHTQVFVIVFGHMISVLLAHFKALHVFRSRSSATLSQLPMLILMVIFTASGLWILSLPLSRS